MKKCCQCKLNKEISSFNKNSSRSDGYHNTCRECMKQYLKNHYKDNKKYYKSKNRRNKKWIRKFLKRIKKRMFCEDCGETHSSCLDFHHIKDDKKFNIGHAANKGVSIDKLKEEIRKCIVLCSNCHRKKHYNAQ